MSDLPQVKLIPAYAWVCEACNHLMYAQCEVPDIQDLEDLYREVYDISDDDSLPDGWRDSQICIDMYRVPETVKCIKCSKEYEIEKSMDDEFEEIEDEWGGSQDDDDDDCNGDYDGGLGDSFRNV